MEYMELYGICNGESLRLAAATDLASICAELFETA
jgi:hypothetical protein